MPGSLDGQAVLIVGGSSGIGRATAGMAAGAGAEVEVASRSEDKLRAVADEIGCAWSTLDMTDDGSVSAWAEARGAVDHLVVTASQAVHGRLEETPAADLAPMVQSKLLGPYRIARALRPKLRDGGSMTFFAGVLSRRPGPGTSGLAMVNAGVEALARALAVELGPRLRVNCVSPGMVRSEAYAGMDEEAREAMFAETGASLPAGQVGDVDEIAQAVCFLMTNSYATGTVLDVDGGHMVRPGG